jgi:hypothetical protein
MADDELSDDEKALLAKHRAARKKNSRKVRIKGRHEESGADYEFELEGDDAERVIARHSSLFAEQAEAEGDDKGDGKDKRHPYFKGTKEA